MEHTSVLLLEVLEKNPIMFDLTDPNVFWGSENPQYVSESREELIKGYNAFLDTLYAIGNVEHTNDWDLSTKLTLRSGETIYSGTGYPEIAIQGDKLLLQIWDEDTDQPDEDGKDPNIYIPLEDILTISVSQ